LTEERVGLNSGPFQLTGKLLVPDHASEKPLPGLIYCCGFPGSEQHILRIAKALSHGGYSVLSLNYRGFRESEGEVDFASQVDDVKAGLTYLETRMEVNRELIGIVGHSAGGALAIGTAAQDLRIKAVAVWGALGNYELFLKFLLSLHGNLMMRLDTWLCRRKYRRKNIIDQMKSILSQNVSPLDDVGEISPRPLLIIHQRNDFSMPAQHAYDLYERAGDPKKLVIVEGRNHSVTDGMIKLTIDWFNCIFRHKQ
jgi:hypothetical protein